jgi:DNA end-binding protein Ku
MPRRVKPDAKTLRMATQLLDSLADGWDPARYHDTYTEELRQRIEAKRKGKKLVDEPAPPERRAEVVDLMAALEASVEAAKGGRARRRPAKKPAKQAANRRKSA